MGCLHLTTYAARGTKGSGFRIPDEVQASRNPEGLRLREETRRRAKAGIRERDVVREELEVELCAAL